MMHIKYYLDRSKIHGVGLFAGENIKQGQLIFTASPLLDVNLTQDQFDRLDKTEKQEIKYWGFFDQSSQRWHVDFDVTKFINHAAPGNVTQDKNHQEAYLVAARNIDKDEELTQNYLEFETADDLKKRGIKV